MLTYMIRFSLNPEVSLVHVRRSGLPIHGLTFQKVPKSVDFHQTNGCNSNTLTSTCHLVISVPRRLAYKGSNLRPLQMCLLSVWRPHILPLDHQVPIKSRIRFHLKWWMDTNHFILRMSIHPPDPNAFLFTDASHYGWGAYLKSMRPSFHGRWWIAPLWPQHPWFSEVLQLLVSAPICLPLFPKLLTQSKGKFQHPNFPLLTLHAWELSSNQLEIKSFRKMLQTLSQNQVGPSYSNSLLPYLPLF